MDIKKLTAQAEALRTMTAKAKTDRAQKWYKIVNQADTSLVYVYDMIGEWGVTAQDFVNELSAISTPNIELHVNSEGGQVFDGIAIYTALKNHPANVVAYVDALAASAASFIIQGADERVMEPNARLMIHDAAGVVVGNAADARSLADLLDDTSDNIASIYAERSGVEATSWRAAMKKDGGSGTWYSAQEAVDAGLADRVAGKDSADATNKISNHVEPKVEADSLPTWDFDMLSAVKEALK